MKINREFIITVRPKPYDGFLINKRKGRKEWAVGKEKLIEYIGEKNADTCLRKMKKSKDFSKTFKFPSFGSVTLWQRLK